MTQQAFTENSFQERLIRLRAENPKAFAVLSPSEKIALEMYLEAKRKAVEPQPTDGIEKEKHDGGMGFNLGR
jgi:hypothetical protein